MRTENDATISTADLTPALRRLLPRGRLSPAARITLGPGEPGMLRVGVGPATEDVPAEGHWRDTVAVSASLLRRIATASGTTSLRLTFHDGTLAANSATITATLAPTTPQEAATPAQAPEPPLLTTLPLFAPGSSPSAKPAPIPPTPASIEEAAAFAHKAERVAQLAKLRHAGMLAKAGDKMQAAQIAQAVADTAQDDDIRNQAATIAMLARMSGIAADVLRRKRGEEP